MTVREDMSSGFDHGNAHVNGVRIHYVKSGNGSLLMCLHGYPDFWYGWRHQLRGLASD